MFIRGFDFSRILVLVGMLLATDVAVALTSGHGTTTPGTDYFGVTYYGGACIGDGTGGKSGTLGGYSNDNGCVPYVANIDDDGDTMPSTWEVTYHLNKYNSQDRYMDADGDHSTNAREYAQSTAPAVSAVTGLPADPKDTDGDGIPDNEDPQPTVAGSGQFNLDGTYSGVRVQQKASTTP